MLMSVREKWIKFVVEFYCKDSFGVSLVFLLVVELFSCQSPQVHVDDPQPPSGGDTCHSVAMVGVQYAGSLVALKGFCVRPDS